MSEKAPPVNVTGTNVCVRMSRSHVHIHAQIDLAATPDEFVFEGPVVHAGHAHGGDGVVAGAAKLEGRKPSGDELCARAVPVRAWVCLLCVVLF